ncbi:glycosyltransferase family 25 protein [Phaeovulum sp.]|uniref:glycosyltransferase family 25 protein n=1 Tax=Phaeovulum sp. TaxID=2934796 RepID=UPI0039E6C52D
MKALRNIPPILVLSLRSELGRRATVSAEMARHELNFQFFEAIDGSRQDASALMQVYDAARNMRQFKRSLSIGEVACAMGHRAMWQEVAQGPAPVVLICEDDLEFTAPPIEFLAAAQAAGSVLEEIIVKIDGPVLSGKRLGCLGGVDLVLTTRLPPRTTAYLIGRKAAARLLQKSGPVARPVDMDLKWYWEHGVPVLVTHPRLVAERAETTSSLTAGRSALRPGSYLARLWRNLAYQSRMDAGRLMHPLRVNRIPEVDALRRYLKVKS